MTHSEFVPVSSQSLKRCSLLKDSLSADRTAARLVILDSYSNQEAADQFGVTRQAV
jgi:hypothetical protein